MEEQSCSGKVVLVVPGHRARAALAFAQTGGQAIFTQADVSNETQVIALIERAVAAFGKLDCAFNNAGIEEEQHPLADCDEQLFDRIMSVNVKGAWLCMKHEIRQMLKQGSGTIVNTASVAGLVGAPTQAAYAASRHVVAGMTKTATVEYGSAGIRINSVCPGSIRTEMMGRAIASEPGREKGLRKIHPIGRIGEAAAAVLWLCSTVRRLPPATSLRSMVA